MFNKHSASLCLKPSRWPWSFSLDFPTKQLLTTELLGLSSTVMDQSNTCQSPHSPFFSRSVPCLGVPSAHEESAASITELLNGSYRVQGFRGLYTAVI